MNGIGDSAVIAYGDESVRMTGSPPFYMLGVAILSNAESKQADKLKDIMPGGSKKLHWRDMTKRLQRESLCLLAQIEHSNLVVIASPLMGNKQERARRKCLEVLLPILEERQINSLVLESRSQRADENDIAFVKYTKGSHLINSIKVTHKEGSEEPCLWIADQVLGAMGDCLTRTGGWEYWRTEWEALCDKVEHLDVHIS